MLILLLLISLLVRLIPIDFPKFTVEEARIADRGYTLAQSGVDELDRKFPLIFNSLDDYQLPATSYLTMLGITLLGKNDLGARIPFVLIGSLVVLLTFQVAKSFNPNRSFRFISAFLAASSPTLIFLSKTPNETIILVFIFTLLFYLLVNKKNLVLLVLTMIVAVLVSKFAWFILLPFLFYTIWLFKLDLRSKRYLTLLSLGVIIVISTFLLFLTVPQAKRSLLENNFSIFSDITIKNGINKLRGQGLESGWPNIIDRLLFNKSHFLITGVLHWLSHFNLSIYFGQFDSRGIMSFSYLGTWVKLLIIPAFLGLISIIRGAQRRNKLFLLIFLILTWPAILIYPNLTLQLTVLTLPFLAIIIAFGCIKFISNRKIVILGFLLVLFELTINVYNFSPEYKNTNLSRPGWIEPMVADVFKSAKNNQTAVSDDVVSDIVPFIGWYTESSRVEENLNIPWPYKFRQYNLASIKIIPSDGKFRTCGKDEKLSVFVSKRDLNKIQQEFDIKIANTYLDNLQDNKVFLIKGICLN